MRSTRQKGAEAATTVTAAAPRRYRGTSVRWRSKCLATATGPSNPRSFPSTNGAFWLRRENFVDVRAGHEHARYSESPGRAVWGGGQPCSDQPGDGGRDGGSAG